MAIQGSDVEEVTISHRHAGAGGSALEAVGWRDRGRVLGTPALRVWCATALEAPVGHVGEEVKLPFPGLPP